MKILVIGGGNMGQTYIHSFLHSHIVQAENLMILEKSIRQIRRLEKLNTGTIYQSPEECVPKADLIIFAVKPQDAALLYAEIGGLLHPEHLVLSIMAGVRIQTLQEGLNINKIVRAMPNLPAQIGDGMTVFTSTTEVSRPELTMVQNLLNTTGKALYVDHEHLLDSATAISGSGPAYVFYFMESIIEAAVDLGFSEAEAELLTWQTFHGAINLLSKNDLSCREWIDRVASRGGTTEAALRCYDQNHLKPGIINGSQAAYKRAQELGESS